MKFVCRFANTHGNGRSAFRDELLAHSSDPELVARTVTDLLAGMTETGLMKLYPCDRPADRDGGFIICGMSEGGLIIRQITLFKPASGRSFLDPGSKFISILLDTAAQGFDVCTAHGVLRSVNPYRWNRRTTKYCSNFATLTDAEREFEKRVRLANDDGFTLNALHAVPPPGASE